MESQYASIGMMTANHMAKPQLPPRLRRLRRACTDQRAASALPSRVPTSEGPRFRPGAVLRHK
eukprot:CAMPEP_0175979992 /NCGR_PEP_ID=MMETSP0108-20121206/46551_1 /TAXON_ID=195067 ORGANISM="Goniomonas pacifica, Strain CCMP1869" /NCGR_SAMPLE_ID=MMETSP0108 /ASSEMBLY_ACC=CAM_ASM_000204 /LENGTH=62 /DNA_ID=CAMNT_0017310399 /DNA_START=75 /DNA_END=263 /DNA_ORIENTATION=+